MEVIYRFDIEQNTPEWEEIKLGCFSGSTATNLLTAKSNEGYKKLLKRIAFERMFLMRGEDFSGNKWTERGHEFEDEAAEDYKFETGCNEVKKVGVVIMNDWVLCSPDRLVNDKGLTQIKCQGYQTHMDYLLGKKISKAYLDQMQFELMVTGREWNDFYAYHPQLQSYRKRIYRDEKAIKELETRINEAIEETKEIIKKLEK